MKPTEGGGWGRSDPSQKRGAGSFVKPCDGVVGADPDVLIRRSDVSRTKALSEVAAAVDVEWWHTAQPTQPR